MLVSIGKSFPLIPELFENPLGKNKSCIRKIISIAFHVFTLWIPYLLVKMCPCQLAKKVIIPIPQIDIATLTGVSSYGVNAIHLSNKLLLTKYLHLNKETSPQSTISALLLLFQSQEDELETLFQKTPSHPWADKEIINRQDNMMALGFCISMLTIVEISNTKNCNPSSIEERDSNTTLFTCQELYHAIRNMEQVPPDSLFYDNDLQQYEWRMLYNECIHKFLESRLDLTTIPQPHLLEKDLIEGSFKHQKSLE
ncbi:MAG: hypothetical protein FJZ59_00060 [Chlamydiae bacterium]|nr:hypothetical protein [Chlamydiota bacterium]